MYNGSDMYIRSDMYIGSDRLVADVRISNWMMDRGSRTNPTEVWYAQWKDGDDRDGKLGSEYGIWHWHISTTRFPIVCSIVHCEAQIRGPFITISLPIVTKCVNALTHEMNLLKLVLIVELFELFNELSKQTYSNTKVISLDGMLWDYANSMHKLASYLWIITSSDLYYMQLPHLCHVYNYHTLGPNCLTLTNLSNYSLH
jgi:hypothetical protein